DDKILLIGKIDGLEAENIFEAALAKTNKSLNEFSKDYHLKLDPNTTNITLGVVLGTKLYFSSFGHNRAILIYRRKEGYEIINVDNAAKDLENTSTSEKIKKSQKEISLFSSVLSGEIPLNSYFVFASESLSEVISGKELVKIITKLPPIVAAEQIKNNLARINYHVPFLGIIIKNTTDKSGQEIGETKTPLTAQNSISSLNYTEEKTETMLAPAGLINLKKAGRNLKKWLGLKKEKKVTTNISKQLPNLEEKKDKTKTLNLPNASSFLRPQKVLLKKSSHHFQNGFKTFISFLPKLVTASFWKNFATNFKNRLKGTNRKSLFLSLSLIVVVIALITSITLVLQNRAKQAQKESFNLTLSQIEEKEALLDSYLLYNNKDGANRVLDDIKEMTRALPEKEEYQISAKEILNSRLSLLTDKVLGLNHVSAGSPLATYAELDLNKIQVAGDKLYGYNSNNLWELSLTNNNTTPIELEANLLSQSTYYPDNKTLYLRDDDKIISLNTETNKTTINTLTNYNNSLNYSGLGVWGSRVYLLSPSENQIFRYTTNFASRNEWLNDDNDLSTASDIHIDGDIYVLAKNGAITKFRLGKKEAFPTLPLIPETEEANKLMGNNDFLYILVGDNRLVRVNKNKTDDYNPGEEIKQYLFSDIILDDIALVSDGSLYLLSANQIYSFRAN
ncbi:MAG: hypothetical protein PWQ35_491, partial [Patescibacteria group bacterium]|nr:hypothetical protein [Patescibacteria group bacterium]